MTNSRFKSGNGQLVQPRRKRIQIRKDLEDSGRKPAIHAQPNQLIVQPSQTVSSDFPRPAVFDAGTPFMWNDDVPAAANYAQFGQYLAMSGDLYRNSQYGGGLILASPCNRIPPMPIRKAAELASIIVDRVLVSVFKNGKLAGSMLSATHLNAMLTSEVCLQQFRPLDVVVNEPMYLLDFTLTQPGYNDGGPGQRVYLAGEAAEIEQSQETINRFLKVMQFESNADRTNAVGAALTVMLRNHWPGAKPVFAVTSTKSHGGKDTVIDFACGTTPHLAMSYDRTNWALEKTFASLVDANPDAGLVRIENARLNNGNEFINSAFIERFVTDPQPVIFTTGTGDAKRRPNNLVIAISTNYGRISEDLMNRALPIHLNPVGDVANRESPIGNPRLEYLPAKRKQIDAELRGMIERWKAAGMPLDETVRHPMSDWARTIGGILKVSGYTDFLANYSTRKTVNDPLRNAMALLGAARPDEWLRPGLWALVAAEEGLASQLIGKADRDSAKSRENGIGRVLSKHLKETFVIETETEKLSLSLEKDRLRFYGGKPHVRYQFRVIERQPLPADDESDAAE